MKRIFVAGVFLGFLAIGCSTAPGESGDGAPARGAGAAGARQRAFAKASQEFGVPEGVLLGVAYMESRWDAHPGEPSRGAGYGPMHLTDADAVLSVCGHEAGADDARGDDARPLGRLAERAARGAEGIAPSLRTMELAASLTGLDRETLRTDAEQNIRAGAALLAHYQREANAGALTSADPADWYGAVARYSGAADAGSARRFADDVVATMAEGVHRVTDDGQEVTLLGRAELRPRGARLEHEQMAQVGRLGLRESAAGETDCPRDLGCEWIPAPYQELGGGDYGNHDVADRPESQRIAYIIIHDTEGYYPDVLRLVQDPTYVSWHYSLRSVDGHVAQHVRTKDVAWHAGNWYVNSKSIGIEHEGFAAQGTWYTEAMYRSSARLVRYLALRNGIPLDRAHILGHDNVQGTVPSTVKTMHWDPGPYWDWAHYFDLLGAPFHEMGNARSGMVTIKPDFANNKPPFVGCEKGHPTDPCPARPSSAVVLHTEPREDAPLLKDVGRNLPDGTSTMNVSDHGSRVSTGQQYAVAERRGDWTAIWYLGQKGWFYNPPSAPAAVAALGFVVTPKEGKESIPVYGRAYPEKEAYPDGVPVQAIVALQYSLLAGQRYAVGQVPETEYLWAKTFDPAGHVVVEGETRYFQIQFGHRVAYVMADDVQLLPSPLGAP